MDALKAIFESLRDVLSGRVRYSELEKLVDGAVIGDTLPDDLPESVLSLIFELQTELELIAEHQSSNCGLTTMYSDEQIVALLWRFGELAEGMGMDVVKPPR